MGSFDELNVIDVSHELYDDLVRVTKECYLKLALHIYKTYKTDDSFIREITEMWVADVLKEYNPVTMYVFEHEVDRKRSRFVESVIASVNKAEEIEKSLRYWSRMITQYAIDITDKAMLQAYKDDGITKVLWFTVEDERRCKKCRELNDKIFDIDKIPPKPHWGCRCYLKAYK